MDNSPSFSIPFLENDLLLIFTTSRVLSLARLACFRFLASKTVDKWTDTCSFHYGAAIFSIDLHLSGHDCMYVTMCLLARRFGVQCMLDRLSFLPLLLKRKELVL